MKVYVIKQTWFVYGRGSKDRSQLVETADADGPAVLSFRSRAAAMAWIREMDGLPAYLHHNESAEPLYTVLRTDKLPKYLSASVHVFGLLDNEYGRLSGRFAAELPDAAVASF